MPEYRNYLLFLEYDGTGFSGWQKQPGCRTVQSELEAAVKKAFGHSPLKAVAAGRTDAGAHALCQAVNLKIRNDLKPYRLQAALNAHLPKDVAVTSVKRIAAGFNARYAAKNKVYQYRIWNRPYRSVWMKDAWHIAEPLDIKAMRTAAVHLLGRHDFNAFYASGGTQENTRAHLKRISIIKRKGAVSVTFEADRFLYKMVRNITGTLAEIGRGRLAPGSMKQILKSRDRKFAGPTAPPHGLFLVNVSFSHEK